MSANLLLLSIQYICNLYCALSKYAHLKRNYLGIAVILIDALEIKLLNSDDRIYQYNKATSLIYIPIYQYIIYRNFTSYFDKPHTILRDKVDD